jgi:excisionase family DNA binding protein
MGGWSPFVWLREVRDTPDHSEHAMACAAALLTFANDGKCWPSIKKLATGAGHSERTAQRAVAELAAAGLLDVDRSRTGRVPLYRLTIPSSRSAPTSVAASPPSVSHPCPADTPVGAAPVPDVHPVVSEGHHTPVTGTPELPIERPRGLPNSTRAQPVAELDRGASEPAPPDGDAVTVTKGPKAFEAQFEQWWSAYPRKVGKAAARTAFAARRRAGTPLDDLLLARDTYADRVTKAATALNFVQHASTFLHGPDGPWSEYLSGPPEPRGSTSGPARNVDKYQAATDRIAADQARASDERAQEWLDKGALSTIEAAEALGVSEREVRDLIGAGRLKAIRHRRRNLIDSCSIEAFAAGNHDAEADDHPEGRTAAREPHPIERQLLAATAESQARATAAMTGKDHVTRSSAA